LTGHLPVTPAGVTELSAFISLVEPNPAEKHAPQGKNDPGVI
jgi:hypothetical protein